MSVSEAAATITRHRDRLKWSKRRLARESGLSPAYISQLENGNRPVTARALARIADAVGLHPYQLLTEGGFIPAEDTAEAERKARLGMEDPDKLRHARADDTGGQFAWLVADYLYLLGHDPYGSEAEGPWIVGVDWSDLAPERWHAMQEGWVNARTLDSVREEARDWLAAQPQVPTQIEGWDELTPTQHRLVQQLVNQLRAANADGSEEDGNEQA